MSKYFRAAWDAGARAERQAAGWPRRRHDHAVGCQDAYFASEDALLAFSAELKHLLVYQKAAFNSPVWFNCGFERAPQCSACFINSVQDTMDSIPTLARTEGMLFKFGRAPAALSSIRSSKEHLAGGGTASGPVSFMKGHDAFAGVKSGGADARRGHDGDPQRRPSRHPRFHQLQGRGREEWALIDAGYDGSFTGVAHSSIFFQNSNNSVRVRRFHASGARRRQVGNPRRHRRGVSRSYRAHDMMRMIAEGTWIAAILDAVRHDRQRMAHVSGDRPHQCEQSVL